MKFSFKGILAAAGLAAFAFSPAYAYDQGGQAAQSKPGVFIGSSAGAPPPGIYMFNQVFTFQGNLAGPGVTTALGGARTGVQAAVDVQGFIFVPGWTFLGATYDAVLVQPFEMVSLGQPVNVQLAGVFNTYFVPVELSWTKIGGTNFAFKTGLGIYAPTGTSQNGGIPGVSIPNGLGNVGSPFWTFQPEAIFSYLGGGWNLSAAIYAEFNTANRFTNYTNGDILHADFTATYTIGKWTFGPVGYYVGQITDDKCPIGICTAFNPLGTLTNAQKYTKWAVGGLLEYNFGPATASVWVTQEIGVKASNSAAAALGTDTSLISGGMTVFGTLSYALWNPPAPPAAPMFHK
jgi:hypothetical protein